MASLNSTPVAPPVVDIIKKYQEILKPSVKGNFGSRRFMLGKNGIATYYFIDKLVDNNLLLLEFLRESGLIKRNLECQKCKQLMKLRSKRTDMLLNNLDFSSHTMADWRQFVNEVILEYVEENSQQIGGKDCIVEIDESKFGKRKYNRGHLVEGQWVLVEWKEVQQENHIDKELHKLTVTD
ncbi:DDE_Tnp_IS1595 domain-containing protein [Trichonephila clavipes]|nr:DDE_Tnp_IS1595 domain-containing protein [Trichonephila clavipes]